MENDQTKLSEQESLRLITDMIQKAKKSFHDTGVSALLWGSAVFIASIGTYLRLQFNLKLPFDIWFITLLAIIPQVIISVRESKFRKFKSHTDVAVDAIWMVYAATLFGLIFYQNVVPAATQKLINAEGWQLVKQTLNGSQPDEIMKPFAPSFSSIFILVYALPTLATGLIKQFRPMIIGAIISYCLFVVSCYTDLKYDMLLSAVTALVCWFIPGIILRNRYLKQKKVDV